MFETWGPRLGVTEDESDHAHREAMRALRAVRARSPGEGARHPRDGRGREPRRHPHGRAALPLRPGPEPRHPGGVPGARLPDPLGAIDPARRGVPRPLLQGGGRARPAPARHQRRVARELLGQQRAEGVGGEVRRAAPERGAARSVELQVRPRRADLRHRRQHRDSASATPYAALHDIDANKPGGSIKIRVKTYAHSLKLHEEALEDAAQEAGRARAEPRQEAPRAARAEARAVSLRPFAASSSASSCSFRLCA